MRYAAIDDSLPINKIFIRRARERELISLRKIQKNSWKSWRWNGKRKYNGGGKSWGYIYIYIYIYSAKSGEKKTEEIVTKNRESRKRKREYISE